MQTAITGDERDVPFIFPLSMDVIHCCIFIKVQSLFLAHLGIIQENMRAEIRRNYTLIMM